MNLRPQNLAPRACGTGDLPVRRSCEWGLTVSQAIEGFILHKNPAFGGAGAQGLSQRTVGTSNLFLTFHQRVCPERSPDY